MTTKRTQQDTGVPLDKTAVSPLEDTEDSKAFRRGAVDWNELNEKCLRKIRPDTIQKVASALGVSEDSLRAMGSGFMEPCWVTFPMRSADGTIIGIRRRKWDDLSDKRAVGRGKNGLFIPDVVTTATVQMICEGESDTAAALTLEFAAIGRASALECIPDAVEFVAVRPNACPCIVVDNDADGESGAERLSWALQDKGVPCRMLHPPKEFKDLRDWLQKGGLTTKQLQGAIEGQTVVYPPGHVPGFSQPPSALMRSGVIARIGAAPVLLLSVIWSYRDADERMFPDREELAKYMGVTERTIDRHKDALAREGLLTWLPGHKERANEYYVDWGPCKASNQKYPAYPALRKREKSKPKTKTE